jgi:hypothetical protein
MKSFRIFFIGTGDVHEFLLKKKKQSLRQILSKLNLNSI